MESQKPDKERLRDSESLSYGNGERIYEEEKRTV